LAHKVTLVPGDGIGPEITEATRRVLEATGVHFQWEIQEAGQLAIQKHGNPLPDNVLESIQRNKVALKGPITTPVGTGFRSVNVSLRKSLDLYANLRPAKSYPGTNSRFRNLDLVVIRENTEDVYAGIEFAKGSPELHQMVDFIRNLTGEQVAADSAISIKSISESASRRIARFAFEFARANGRKKVTAVHKANIMKCSDGLFLAATSEVAREYPGVEFEDRIVDNMAMQLVQKPEMYDVLVLPNLYGDIISDLCAGLVGGLGLAPGANIGDQCAVFEPVHGSVPKYAGKNVANPMAMMLSGVMMLRYLGEPGAADLLERAVAAVIAEGKVVTNDLKGSADNGVVAGTREVADAVIEKMRIGVS